MGFRLQEASEPAGGFIKSESDAVDLEWGPEKFHPKEALLWPVWGPYLENP